MGNDNRPAIVLDGDVAPFRRALRDAGSSLKKFGTDAEGQIKGVSGPLADLQEKFVAVGALLAGGAVFKEAVAKTSEFTEESMKLGRALDVTAGEASVLRETLEQSNTSQDEYMRAAQHLGSRLRENEAVLTALGLRTRDAAGHLRPLNELTLEGIGLLGGYRSSTDRAVAAQTMFGHRFELTSNLARMNKEAVAGVEQQMRALGVVVSQENVAAWEAFDDAGDRAGLTLTALKTTIGNALLPVLTKLGNWFSAIGPAAVVVIKGALGGLVSLFWGLKTAASIAFELINASVIQLTEPIRAVSVAFWKLIHGDFDGARAEIANIPKVWSQGWNTAFDTIVQDAIEARDRMWELFAEGTPAEKAAHGNKAAPRKPKETGEEAAHMATYEAALAARKNLYEQENTLREFSKEQELAYWRELQATYVLTSKDQLAIAKKTAQLELEIRRQAAKDQRELQAATIDHRRAAALAQVQFDEQQAANARENGAITQRELIAQQEELARRRFEIDYQAALARLELARTDPNASPAELARVKEQLLEIERQYVLRRAELQQQTTVEGMSTWRSFVDTIGGLWDKGIGAMMNGTLTLRNAWRAVMTEMVGWFVSEVIGRQVKEWIAAQARMLAVKMGFITQEKAIETAAAATTVATKTAETTKVVGEDAIQAATGAAKSQAGIPIAGPVLAMAAMAAMFAAVMAMGNRKSAARGYDIPRGLNPLVQTHEEEMILPSPLANGVRRIIANQEQGGAGGGDTHHHWTVQAWDARDVKRFFMDHKAPLADALKSAHRDGKR